MFDQQIVVSGLLTLHPLYLFTLRKKFKKRVYYCFFNSIIVCSLPISHQLSFVCGNLDIFSV